MRWILLVLILFPYLAIAQATSEDYAIYSAYLKQFKSERQAMADLVVRTSTDHGGKGGYGFSFVIDDLRGYLKNDPSSLGQVLTFYRPFGKTGGVLFCQPVRGTMRRRGTGIVL